MPLGPAFAQTTTAPETSDTSGTSSPTADQTDTSTVSPSTTDTATETPSTETDQTPDTSQTSATPSTPSTPTAPTASGADDTSKTNNQTTQTANTDLAPLVSGVGTGPDLQPVVYNSFNQTQTKIDKNTGALQTSYPIDIPPGRNGIQPDLNLIYNSENATQSSIFGEGWSIDIPYIERLNLTGADQLYSTTTPDYFTSSLDGELSTTTIAGNYIARTDYGTFNSYTFSASADSWTMVDKNGTTYVFGGTSDSQQNDPDNASDTFKWMLNKETDANGNSIVYTYFDNNGQIYPSSTVYDNTTSTAGIFEIDFQHTSSTDNGTLYATGFPVQSNYRINEIDIKVNGIWVRKYVLDYTTGDNDTTALLHSITESGENASGIVVTMPASTFTYQTATAGWTSTTLWNPPTSFVANGGVDEGVRLGDVLGNGLSDIIASSSWMDNGNGWTSSSTWNAPISFATNGADNGWRVIDLTNNGLDDLISCSGAYINTGNGWTSSSTWTSPVCFANNGTSTGAIIADVTGDGLPAILQGYTDASSTAHYAAWVDTGSGWATSTVWAPPISFVTYGGVDNGVRLLDANGDGLPDILQGYTDASDTAHYAAWLDDGNGWATSTVWNPPIPFMSNGGWDNGARFADLDGNGLTDIIQGYTDVSGNPHYAAYIDTGSGWATSTAWNSPALFDTDGGYDNGARIADVLGTGLPAILQGYTDYQGNPHYASWLNNNTVRADILTSITYPQGGSSAITYKTASQFMTGSSTFANTAPYPVFVVTEIATSDGSGNITPMNYKYASGTYYWSSPINHEFAGFGLITQADGAGNVTKTYYDTGTGNSTSTGQYQDNFWKIGEPYRVEQYGSTGALYKTTITKWDDASRGGSAAFVFPDGTLTMEYDGGSLHDDSADSFAYNTATGNETQGIQWGQVTGNDDGSFATSSLGYVTDYAYASSAGSNVKGKISDETLTNPSSTKVQETRYYYDDLGLGSIGAGNLTEQADWMSGSSYADTQHSYNGYGLVTQTLDPRNNTTTYTYDVYDLYPATTTNALGQSIEYSYDYSTGKPTQTTDPNGNIFQSVYDGVGRVLDILEPEPSASSTLVTSTAYIYTDTANAVNVEEEQYLNATTSIQTYTYYDGLDRPIQVRKSSDTGGVYKVSDETYNNTGLTASQSLPYFADGSSKSSATTTPALYTYYAYDPLQRMLTSATAVGTTTNTYGPWMTTTTDPNGNVKGYFYDAFGNLIEVQEHNSTSIYTTDYSYDGLKNLTNITDANGNVRNFTYDSLGNRLMAQDLHPTTSSAYGTWYYSYDMAGNLASSTDPDGNTVDYVYDALNREASEAVSGQSGNAVIYTYDSCTNGIGRLCEAVNGSSTVEDSYDSLGDIASETKVLNGNSYITSYTYDWQKNKITVTNPDDSVIAYIYNNAGLLSSVAEEEPSSTWDTIVSSIAYSPMDQIETEEYGDGATTNNIYDPTRLYRLNSTVTTVGGSQQQMIEHGIAKSFGLQSLITDSCTGQEATYTVPAGVTHLEITAYGAQGGESGGLGGEVQGRLSVTPSSTYYLMVGCQNGYNGGGSAGSASDYGATAGAGGGMTWFSANSFFSTSTVLMVAGGGGGTGSAGYEGSPGGGGVGGGMTAGIGGNADSGLGANGGLGGTQSSGGGGGYGYMGGGAGYVGLIGQGGNGGFGAGSTGNGGGGGGGGYYGGGGGGGSGVNAGLTSAGGGGGGGSSYFAATASLINTSTIAGVNSGNGSITITPIGALSIASSSQYYLDGVIPLGEGSSTGQGGVVLGATLTDSASTTLQLQIEVEPAETPFTDVPNVTSSPSVAPGNVATTSFFWANGSYHWQARAIDANNNTSSWEIFGPSSTSTDFILAATSTLVEPYTGILESYTVPAGVTQLGLVAYGAQGGSSSGAAGLGAVASGTLSVTPGTTYYYEIGESGANSSTPFGAGGAGGTCQGGCGGAAGVAGGGMTWFASSNIFSTSTAILVAGGGGGGGGESDGGSGGAGGGGGYPSGSTGVDGTGFYGGASGGVGGTQNSGYAAGQGGAGANGNTGASSGGGGGGGWWGGDGGNAAGGSISGSGGGGGGSSYFSSILTNTSTINGTSTGNGYLVIYQPLSILSLSPFGQYYTDGVTPLGEGSSTGQGTVIFNATLNATSSESTTTLKLQVEVESAGMAFTGIPNVSDSSLVAPGSVATTSFTGPDGSYHWQARWMDAHGNTSPWQIFGLMPAATDFTLITQITEFYTGSAGSFTVPAHVKALSIIAAGAQGGNALGGLGGVVSGTLSVIPGTKYYFSVGGQNGYGGGGTPGSQGTPNIGGSGGGMTWFSASSTFSTSTVLLVAGGGGGAGGPGEYGSLLNGGIAGGLSGASGGSGNYWCGGSCYGPVGGGGGTQTMGGTGGGGAGNGSSGLGGNGTDGVYCCSVSNYSIAGGGGGGGGAGYYGGGGGEGGVNNGGGYIGAGGGGGSSYISASLINATTTSGINSGNGSLVITEIQDLTPFASSPGQYYEDGATPLSDGSSTGQNTVVFSATVGSYFARSLQFQVEVEPQGTAFTDAPNATSSFVGNGDVATTSFTGENGSYHWQYRVIDAQNNTSTWQQYYSGEPVSLYDSPLYSDPGLVSYYPMEGDVNDVVSGNNGIATRGTFGTQYGKFNQGENLASGYDLIASSTSLQVATFTISLWAQFYAGGSGALYGYYVAPAANRAYSLLGGIGSLSLYINTNLIMTTPSVITSTSTWYDIVAERSDGIASIYINGDLIATTTSADTIDFSSPCGGAIGAFITLSCSRESAIHSAMNLDDLSVWNRSLSAAEISDLYTGDWLSTMSDFTLAAPTVSFTTPTNGTTTPNFTDWEINATNITSTQNYNLKVQWDDSTGDPAVSSTVMTTGADIVAGVSVPKPTSTFDYTYDGTPVLIDATATLMDASTTDTVATTSINYTEQTTVAPLNCSASTIQCISYEYDNDGNITQITDDSGTDAAKTVYYTYDNLNRLMSASSTGSATGTDYAYNYTYDPVGNILSGPEGAYTYGGTGYPNPDAVTGITQGSSTVTFSYDNNGNLASSSDDFAYTWDYKNHLISATTPSSTWSYGYDYTGERVFSENGTSTPIYDPEATYDVAGNNITKNIFGGSALAATILGSGASSTAYTVLPNNLGSTNVILDSSGSVAELLDYYPYGGIRLDEQSGINNRRKYIGQQYDGSTGLLYLNARYYDSSRGQFLSEDPVFLAIGSQKLSQLIGGQISKLLSNPQSLNSYSYAMDNPTTKSDPSGKSVQSIETQLSNLLSELNSLLQQLSSIVGGGSIDSGKYSTDEGNPESTPNITLEAKSNSALNGSEGSFNPTSIINQSGGGYSFTSEPAYSLTQSAINNNFSNTKKKELSSPNQIIRTLAGGSESIANGLDIYSHLGDIDNSPDIIAEDAFAISALAGSSVGPEVIPYVAAGVTISIAAADVGVITFSTISTYLYSQVQ